MTRTRFPFLTLFILVGCTRPQPEEPAHAPAVEAVAKHLDEKAHDELPSMVRLSPEIVKEAQIAAVPAERRALPVSMDLSGQIAPDPDRVALLGARASGRVLKVLVREGDTVHAGQTIALITSTELAKLRGSYAAAAARSSAARRNAERLRSLAQRHLGSDQDALAAEAEALAAEAERDASGQAIKGMGAALAMRGDPSILVVVTPIAGQVTQRDAVPGQIVEPSHTLATVADLSKVWFQALLFEKDLSQIREGAGAEVRLNGYPEQVFPARVARISSQIDPQTRTLTARLAFDGPAAVARLGLFGTARISLAKDSDEATVVVPLSAVTSIGDRKTVFVRHPDGDFELHRVTLGHSAGGSVAVLSGLNEGELVVVAGVHTLKSALFKGTMAEDD